VLRKPVLVVLLAAAGGCAGYAGQGLLPGQSTEQDVIGVMGRPALERAGAGGERVLWYPRLPFGRESYAARIDAQGRLVTIEQRLAPEVIARLRPGHSTADDVLDLIGPPYDVYHFPRMQREVWEYQLRTPPSHRNLYVQISPDRMVREIYQLHDFQAEDRFLFVLP
jgi:hypothetical protein